MRRLTLPMIRPGLFAGATLVLVWSFTEHGTPMIVHVLRRAEAEWIARRIRSWIDGGEGRIPAKDAAGEPTLRPVEYGDIAILFRALSDADLYEKALDRLGVPYYVAVEAFNETGVSKLSRTVAIK